MQLALKKKINDLIDQFLALIQAGSENYVQAGKVLIELTELDEEVYAKIIAASKNVIQYDMLLTLERIGRGELHPRLLLLESPAAQRVIKLGLPYKKQEELLDRPIPVAKVTENGVKTVHKRIDELTAAEAAIAIDDTGVKPIEQQAEIIVERAKHSHSPLRYRIEGDFITFYARTTLSRDDIWELLDKLESRHDVVKV